MKVHSRKINSTKRDRDVFKKTIQILTHIFCPTPSSGLTSSTSEGFGTARSNLDKKKLGWLYNCRCELDKYWNPSLDWVGFGPFVASKVDPLSKKKTGAIT
jgi:hypothetical protein